MSKIPTWEKPKNDRELAESKLVYSFTIQTNQQLAQKYHIVEGQPKTQVQ